MEKRKKKNPTFKDIIIEYICQLNGIHETAPSIHKLFVKSITIDLKKFLKNKKDFSIKYKSIVKKIKSNKKYKLSKNEDRFFEDFTIVKDLQTKLNEDIYGLMQYEESIIINSYSQFDRLVSKIIKYSFNTEPKLFNCIEEKLDCKSINSFKTIKAIKRQFLENYIKKFLYESKEDQFSEIENKFHIDIKTTLPNLGNFFEIKERRNLYTHNNGKITKEYISLCNKYSIPCNKKIGDYLIINKDYITNVYDTLIETGLYISYLIVKKIKNNKEKIYKIDSIINDLVIEKIIKKEKYDLCISLLKLLSLPNEKYSGENIELISVINTSLCYKLNKNEIRCKEIINSIDWSSKNDVFNMAKSVLLDNYDEAARRMIKISKEEKGVSDLDYKTWPLFYIFRTTPQFLKTYKDIFKKEFIPYNENITLDDIENTKEPKKLTLN